MSEGDLTCALPSRSCGLRPSIAAAGASSRGAFMYQFEALCRNRLRYEPGLDAMVQDPIYDQPWREWLKTVRRQIGIVDFADLVYVRSQHYVNERLRRRQEIDPDCPVLFGEKEGKIAVANRRKDPLYLFAALQRHLGYPQVPRPKPVDETPQLIPQLLRRMERLETRIKLLEDEQKGGIDITKFYGPPGSLPGHCPTVPRHRCTEPSSPWHSIRAAGRCSVMPEAHPHLTLGCRRDGCRHRTHGYDRLVECL